MSYFEPISSVCPTNSAAVMVSTVTSVPETNDNSEQEANLALFSLLPSELPAVRILICISFTF